jgi:hypothetical protein
MTREGYRRNGYRRERFETLAQQGSDRGDAGDCFLAGRTGAFRTTLNVFRMDVPATSSDLIEFFQSVLAKWTP